MSLLLEIIEKHTNFTRKSEKFNIIFGDAYEFVNVLCGLMKYNCIKNIELGVKYPPFLGWVVPTIPLNITFI